jgi:hypothetical protein
MQERPEMLERRLWHMGDSSENFPARVSSARGHRYQYRQRSYGRALSCPCGTTVVFAWDPLQEGLKVKYAKVAAVAAGTLMAVGAATPAFADSGAAGSAKHSPGFISGNVVQVPVHVPVNVCGNTVNFIALLNPAFGNNCVNH